MSITVRTQQELDAAITAAESTIYIESADGVWLELRSPGSSHVVARGSSHVVARDSSHVVAWDSSHVVARDSSHVVAWDSSHVEAWGSSHVEARDSSHVVAWGSSHVEARDSSHVEAGAYTAVHLHSARAEVEGGVLIDLTTVDLGDPAVWCDFHGVTVEDGQATVYKAVRDELRSAHGFAYPIGETVTCGDWQDSDECGHGLHFSPTPSAAKDYDSRATRYLECQVALATLRPLLQGGAAKCKAPAAEVVREVNLWREPIQTPAAAAEVSA